MKTRAEHVEALSGGFNAVPHWTAYADIMAASAVQYAIEHGMPVAPDLVDPVVGNGISTESDYEAMPAGVAVEKDGGRWFKVINERISRNLWVDTDGDHWSNREMSFESRLIVFVPDAPEPEPFKHETVVFMKGDWMWKCSCGLVSGRYYAHRWRAEIDSAAHQTGGES